MARDWSDSGNEIQPKPFSKVPLRGPVSRRAIPWQVQERVNNENRKQFVPPRDRFGKGVTGRLNCRVKTVCAVHVGSGIYGIAEKEVIRACVTLDDRPILPATSLKGAVRSVAEAISRSCVRVIKGKLAHALSLEDAKPCGAVDRKSRSRTKLCTCCSIFGALGYQGRVSFDDALLLRGEISVHKIQSPYPPRETAHSYKNTRRLYDGRKFYYHGTPVPVKHGEPYQVVKRGAEFQLAMHFDSLAPEELCLLLVSMGISDDIIIKCGGGKQAMLGSVEIFPLDLEIRNPVESFTDFSGGVKILSGDALRDFTREMGDKHADLIDEDALDQLMSIWDRDNPREAPTGIY